MAVPPLSGVISSTQGKRDFSGRCGGQDRNQIELADMSARPGFPADLGPTAGRSRPTAVRRESSSGFVFVDLVFPANHRQQYPGAPSCADALEHLSSVTMQAVGQGQGNQPAR